MPRAADLLAHDDLIDAPRRKPEGDPEPFDSTRQPLDFPASRAARLQNLATRVSSTMGYSTQRGYGNTHLFAAEIRYGFVEVEMHIEELGFAATVGEIDDERWMQEASSPGNAEEATQVHQGGYGLTFGYGERKAMSMALVDRPEGAGTRRTRRPPGRTTTSSCCTTATTPRPPVSCST